MKNNIQFYGAQWCTDCRRCKKLLDELNVEYEYIDLESVPGAADKVIEINKGMQSIPTIVFPDNSVLVEPSNEEINNKLSELSLTD